MNKLISVVLILTAMPVMAHHPLNGMPMETFSHGILSGIGHPIFGFDHLFFVLIVGVAALFTGRKFLTPFVYIAAMLVGCVLMVLGVNLPLKETIIALSLLTVGGIVLIGHGLAFTSAIVLFAAFGLFHGSVFAEPIVGQEGGLDSPVLIGYLLGLGVIQYLLALTGGWVVEKPFSAIQANHINARLCGAVVAGIGLFLILEAFEGTMLAALGIG